MKKTAEEQAEEINMLRKALLITQGKFLRLEERVEELEAMVLPLGKVTTDNG